MNDIKTTIAKNIVELRKKYNITQLELANKLNYTDKAISKWERGESIPDVIVLKNIADIFNVTVDYLLEEEHTVTIKMKDNLNYKKRNYKLITAISVFFIFLFAAFAFFIASITNAEHRWYWLPFIYAIPMSLLLVLILNSIWFKGKHNHLIISCFVWTVLTSIYLTLLTFNNNLWILFIVGIPAQGIIWLWSGIHYKAINNHYDD